MRTTTVLSLVAGLLLGLVGSNVAIHRVARSQESKNVKPISDEDLDGLEASATAFETAFNKGDAAALAAQFIEAAEVVDEDGNVVQGREQIQARFAELFKAYPKAKIDVEVTSLRKLSPDIAVEDGYSASVLDPDDAGSRSPYTLVHLKRNGKWLIASVRDFPEETQPTAHDQLQPLAWLVGDWVDQSGDSKVETSCKWAEDGNFLIQEYVVKIRGGAPMRGTQRIGWDPLKHTIRAWAFDHSGGFGESTWTQIDDRWIIKAEGVTPDGKAASATRILTPISSDLFELTSISRIVGQEVLPDASVRVARRPPTPTE